MNWTLNLCSKCKVRLTNCVWRVFAHMGVESDRKFSKESWQTVENFLKFQMWLSCTTEFIRLQCALRAETVLLLIKREGQLVRFCVSDCAICEQILSQVNCASVDTKSIVQVRFNLQKKVKNFQSSAQNSSAAEISLTPCRRVYDAPVASQVGKDTHELWPWVTNFERA